MALVHSIVHGAAHCMPYAARSAVVPRVRQINSPRSVAAQASKAKFFVGGNWKCNGTHSSVEKLVAELNAGNVPSDIDVVVAPPFIFLDWVRANITSSYQVAAQNCWTKPDGAFTGEISAEMLKDAGVPWVITGHSERRLLLGESNRTVGLKTGHALEVGLSVIACIGETLEQRNTGHLYDTIDQQLQALFENVQDWSRVVLAYEPVWAIGTGVVASPEQAQEVHAYVRKVLSDRLGKSTAESIRIIYGGSVNDANCADLATREDIDGFLVGGASLKGPAFITICNARRGAALAK